MRYQNDVIRLVLLHIRANLGMILALHVTRLEACTKQRAKTQMACKSLDLNPINLLKRNVRA